MSNYLHEVFVERFVVTSPAGFLSNFGFGKPEWVQSPLDAIYFGQAWHTPEAAQKVVDGARLNDTWISKVVYRYHNAKIQAVSIEGVH